jgi:outer membrane protein with beta-barrel domain
MDRKTKGIIITAVLLAAGTITTPAAAQRMPTSRPASSTTSSGRSSGGTQKNGLLLSAYTLVAPGVSVAGQDIDGEFATDMGYGAGVMVGYAFSPMISGYASLDIAKQNSNTWWATGSMGLSHFEVGVRAALPMGSPTTTPYLAGAFGRRNLGGTVEDQDTGDTYAMGVSGTGFSLGGGIEHVMSEHVSLDGGLMMGFGKLNHAKQGSESADIQVNGTTSFRVKFGVNWRP